MGGGEAVISNTQRTLKYLRDQGLSCGMVEKWNPYAKIRQDLFGFIDIIAIGSIGIVGVQSCSDTGRSEHRNKILENPYYKRWRSAGCKVWLVTWGLHGERGKRKKWTPHVEDMSGGAPAIEPC